MNTSTSKHTSFSLVSKNELPFHCPPKEAQKWSLHPKVFLSFDKEGKALNLDTHDRWRTARDSKQQEIFNYFQKYALISN